MPIIRRATPPTPHERRRARGRSPGPAARSPMVPTQIAARSFWPEALPAVTVGSGSSRVRTSRGRARASTDESGRTCSSVSTRTSALRPLSEAGTISSTHRHSLGSSRCPLMAPRRVFVLFRAGDRVLRSQLLQGLQHPLGAGWFRPLAVSPRVRAPPWLPSASTWIELRIRHRFRTPGWHDLRRPRLHLHRCVDDGLQTRSAPAVDLQPGRDDGQRRALRESAMTVALSPWAETSRWEPPKPRQGSAAAHK
jgi:hypothetical protein